jgi:hypothetical protein
MVAKPEIAISAEEPKADELGQLWSPAKVTFTWPATKELPAPCVQIFVVAPVRGAMTVDELRGAQMQSAHDVLTAALLSIETVPEVRAAIGAAVRVSPSES